MKAEIIFSEQVVTVDLNTPLIEVTTNRDGLNVNIIGGVGPQGNRGEAGPKGDKGEPGEDYVLTEEDKQEIAESIDLSAYVRNTDWATGSEGGVVKVSSGSAYGITMGSNDHILRTALPSAAQIKSGGMAHTPITPQSQHEAVFYGLAKVAGADMKNSDNPVGTYTDEAKAAIQAMLDVPARSDIPVVPVKGVQIDGNSVIDENGTANIPIASDINPGVIRVSGDRGLAMTTLGNISLVPAPSSMIKAGEQNYFPITPKKQHEAVFYGLAKAAGCDEKDSTLQGGMYTDEAKIAIRAMLGLDDQSIIDLVEAGLPTAEEVEW